jgi:hypothetical protein
MFSALTVAIAFFQKLYALDATKSLDNYFTAFTVCLGICILVISLIEWGVANGVRSAALYRNAEELNGFQREILQKLVEFDLKGSVPIHEINDAREKYEHVRTSCEHNHSPIDDWHVRAVRRFAPEFCENEETQMSWGEAQRIRIAWNASAVSYFGVLWLFVIGFLALPLVFASHFHALATS